MGVKGERRELLALHGLSACLMLSEHFTLLRAAEKHPAAAAAPNAQSTKTLY
jgi:hypothetical protein